MGDVVWGLADFEAILDGVAWVISGAWLGFLSGLSSILSSSLGSASVFRRAVFRCQPGDGGSDRPTGRCVVLIYQYLSYNNSHLVVFSGDDPQCSPSI